MLADLSKTTIEQLRASCFDEAVFGAEPSLVRRKAAWCIRRYASFIDSSARGDVLQEVYAEMLAKFDALVEHFRADPDRIQSWNNFEKYLHMSIRNQVLDALRKFGREHGRGIRSTGTCEPVEAKPTQRDTERDVALSDFRMRAFTALSDLERQILWEQYFADKSPAELASQRNLPIKLIYKTTYEAKLKFRCSMIQAVVERRLARNDAEADLRLVIVTRCRAGKPCYMYRVNCPTAREPAELAAAASPGTQVEAAVAGLRRLTNLVKETLDDWDLHTTLDQCPWVVYPKGGSGLEKSRSTERM